MANRTNFSELSDQELLIRIKDNTDYLGIVYNRCKPNCINFMRKMTSGKTNIEDLEDVFQDASIILYEKIVKGNFVLTASFQVYMNSVCRFQLLNKIGKSKLTTEYQENSTSNDDENPVGYISTITDTLDEIEDYKEDLFKTLNIVNS